VILRTIVPDVASSAVPLSQAPAWIMASLAVIMVAILVLRKLLSRRARVTDSKSSPPDPLQKESVERLNPNLPVAVFLVGSEHQLEPASIRVFRSTHAPEYRQILFLSVGVFDYHVMDAGIADGGYADPEKAKHLRIKTRLALDPYLAVAHEMGLAADCRVAIATDPVDEIDRMSTQVAATYPRAVFFVTKLVFRRFTWFYRLFQAGSSDAIQKRLEKKGFPVTVIPLVLPT
jgi:hypothetical protein